MVQLKPLEALYNVFYLWPRIWRSFFALHLFEHQRIVEQKSVPFEAIGKAVGLLSHLKDCRCHLFPRFTTGKILRPPLLGHPGWCTRSRWSPPPRPAPGTNQHVNNLRGFMVWHPICEAEKNNSTAKLGKTSAHRLGWPELEVFLAGILLIFWGTLMMIFEAFVALIIFFSAGAAFLC